MRWRRRPVRDRSALPHALLIIALVLAFGALPACTPGRAADQEPVRVRPVPLDAARPDLVRIDRLRLEAGYVLSARDDRFGGLSGLWLAPDGGRMIAASDGGTLWLADLGHGPDGRLTGFGGWRAVAPGRRAEDPRSGNAEALSQAGADRLVVAYEGEHRLRSLSLTDLAAVPDALALPEQLEGHRNRGIEALATLEDGSLLALSEGVRDAQGDLYGWQIAGEAVTVLAYATTEGFVPTGADRLGGTLYVVERRFSLLGGFACRIVRLAADAVRRGARLAPEPLAVLAPPLVTDNCEAIAARRGPDGRALLYVLSDDNFNALQRTLLLQFSLAE